MATVVGRPSIAPQQTLGFNSSTWANEPPSEAERVRIKSERELIKLIYGNNLNEIKKIQTKYNFESSGKMSPLHTAVSLGHTQIVDHLIRGKADVNSINSIGYSPLMTACSKGNEDIVKVLRAAGADKTIVNGKGLDAAQICRNKNYKNLEKLL
jgi:ankyrin repeat protein